MFWWYWSLRRRLLSLAVLVAPLLVFAGLRVFTGGAADTPPSDVTSSVPSSDVVSGSTQVAASAALTLEVRDDESRSAASIFPAAFGDLPEEITQTRNLVFPGMAPEEYSFYVFAGYEAPDASDPAVTAPTTTVATPSPSSATEDVLDRFTAHFRGVGARVIERESRAGTQLEITGIEAGRGYRTLLSFLEVPAGVVVRGVVVRVPANEVADLLEEVAPTGDTAGTPGADAADPGSAGEADDDTNATTTVPTTTP